MRRERTGFFPLLVYTIQGATAYILGLYPFPRHIRCISWAFYYHLDIMRGAWGTTVLRIPGGPGLQVLDLEKQVHLRIHQARREHRG